MTCPLNEIRTDQDPIFALLGKNNVQPISGQFNWSVCCSVIDWKKDSNLLVRLAKFDFTNNFSRMEKYALLMTVLLSIFKTRTSIFQNDRQNVKKYTAYLLCLLVTLYILRCMCT